MKIDNKYFSRIRSASAVLGGFWSSHYSGVFVLVFLLVTAWGSYIWYQTMYQSGWSNSQKEEYVASQRKDINLKEQQLRDMLERINKRSEKYRAPLEDHHKGFFRLDK